MIGGMAGAVFNAAKEQALDLFLIGNIGFLDMARCVEFALNEYELNPIQHNFIFEDIMELDTHMRIRVIEMAKVYNMMELLASIPIIGGTISLVIPFLIVISIVVFIHEYGHYIVGRWCGIHAEVFSVGMGRPIFSKIDKNGTKWQISLIPLGGYVKFLGDINASSTSSKI